MPIPDYQTLMRPLLQLAADQQEHKLRDAVETLANHYQLNETERSEILPSGTQTVFSNRVGWARSYLKQAGALRSPRRGHFVITDRGLHLLQGNPDNIRISTLEQFPEFQEFKNRRRPLKPSGMPTLNMDSEVIFDDTPEDILASAYRLLRQNLEQEVLETVKEASPVFFEKLVVDLLVKMGYGGNRQDAGRAIGKSGDGGIDGIINEDRLGLDVIYMQAKRWEATVGRPEIQKFAGALQGQRAKKGIFITTSGFSREARDYARIIDTRIILIDGEKLAALMVEYNVGISVVERYEVKKVDTDYFEGG
ncbi:MAG TPA: restriction endonuclease [Candidatus Thiothrix moscowensis]|uniref:restriction endonuclease n=1 Tax=unclassified Thiothrix TaxID=2636184 RepID=UPI0025EB4643|nr:MULTISPECIES: restriction endonuclease [unclassified Thiothrix]HRJ53436.1 restriction endonuclease [Candidatus Thiothrix moscowensis]HRJ93515.1 restriction endonuclease [Candidatus Thiothrix moscowensis]